MMPDRPRCVDRPLHRVEVEPAWKDLADVRGRAMRSIRLLGPECLLFLSAVAGCGDDADDASDSAAGAVVTSAETAGDAPETEPVADDVEPAAIGAVSGCSEHEGQPGVIRVFCDGPATAELVIGGRTFTISGGECETADGNLAFNAGVVAMGFEGPPPDYLGMLMSPGGDPVFTSVIGTVAGEAYAVSDLVTKLDVDGGTGEFTGTTDDGAATSGRIDCG
jgi:hypothetical protein